MKTAVIVTLALAACVFPHGPADQGITSPTHQAHVGGIVFSHAVIPRGAEDPTAFVDRCVLGKPCYGRFYLERSLGAAAGSPYVQVIALRATVDGRPMPDGNFTMVNSWSTYNFTLFRADGDTEAWEHPSWFLDKVASQLAPGDHVLELAVLAVPAGTQVGAGKPIATGRLTYTVPADAARIIAAALPRERRLVAAASQQNAAQVANNQAALDAEDARPVNLTLSNSCVNGVTFMFATDCGQDKPLFVTVPEGGNKPLVLHFPGGTSCSVCIAGAGGACKYVPTTISKDTTEVSVSASAGCDSPSTH